MKRTIGAFALASAVTLSACGGSTTDSLQTDDADATPVQLAVLADAVDATAALDTGRVRVELSMRGTTTETRDGETSDGLVIDGTIVTEVAADSDGDTEMLLDFGDALVAAQDDNAEDDLGAAFGEALMTALFTKTHVIVEGETAYVQSGLIGAFSDIDPDTWVRQSFDPSTDDISDMAIGVRPEISDDILAALDSLSGEPETIGNDAIEGVETTHYRAEVTPAQLAEVLETDDDTSVEMVDPTGTIPLDLWIDDDDRLRQISFSLTGAELVDDGGLDEMSATITWSELGGDFDITAPEGPTVDIEELTNGFGED